MCGKVTLIQVENARNVWTQDLHESLRVYTTRDLLELASALHNGRYGEHIGVKEQQVLIKCLATPALLAEIQRRMTKSTD